MYESILVPTDGSEHAERAAVHAFALAEAFDATVHVLGVADVAAAAGPFNAGGVSGEFLERLEADAEEAVADVASLAPHPDVVERAVVRGAPGEEILAYAEEESVDLIAMGTHGRSGLSRLVAGSVTEHVLRRGSGPVVTARVADDDPVSDYEDVLIPTDGSEPAGAAVAHGVAVAAAFDATVHVLNVVDVGAMAAGADAAPPTALLDQLVERGEEATGAVADRVREADLEVVTEVREGFPGPDLLEYAEEESVDLIAMGTHGRTGVDRLLLGSTTERTIRRAPMPVLSVPPERES